MKTRIGIGSFLAVLALLTSLLILPSVAGPAANVVGNGDFEGGFYDGVGLGWSKFHNCQKDEDLCTASFHDDTWWPVVYDGAHSQLIEINTFCRGASTPNRVAGIYQTVSVTPGTTYELCFYGLLRAMPGDRDPESWGYTVNVGIDQNGGTDWTALAAEDWIDVPWDTVYPRTGPPSLILPGFEPILGVCQSGGVGPPVTWPEACPDQQRPAKDTLESFCMDVTAESDSLTLFIRLWKKWPTASREVLLNLDAISFEG
jgi:hypothetical protein